MRPGQTVLVDSASGWKIELSPTITVSGQVIGNVVTPWAVSELPGEQGPIDNVTVRFSRENSIQGAVASTDENGQFAVELVWDSEPYLFEVIPASTQTPSLSTHLFQDDYSSSDLGIIELGAGVALYGRVIDESGDPIPSAQLRVVDENGSITAETVSNALGWYSVRVLPNRNYEVITRATAQTPRSTVDC